MKLRTAIFSLPLMALASFGADAGETACPWNYAGGTAPDIVSSGLSQRVVELCFEEFGVFHSGVAAVPLWSAEALTAERVRKAKSVDRVDVFHPEERLAPEDRGELAHYRGSGFDRGHLAPSADMATDKSQAESFSLANIVPQHPGLNRNLWAHIEATARGLALAYGEVNVVTGVSFGGQELRQIGERVLVPTAVYKAVYVPSAGAAAAWWAPNTEPGDRYEVISIEELAYRTGVNVFPHLPESVRQVAAVLPKPTPAADRAAGSRESSASESKKAEKSGFPSDVGSALSGVAIRAAKELLK